MSRLPFELLLALRYLRPRRTFVSVITMISVLGVTLGVAVLIIVISVMSGFDRELRDKIHGFGGDLKIYRLNHDTGSRVYMQNYALTMSMVSSNAAVKAVAPFILEQVVLQTEPTVGDPEIVPAFLRGIDPMFETNVSAFLDSVRPADYDLGGRGLLIGEGLALGRNLRVGDHVAIYTTRDLEKLRRSINQTNQEAVLPPDYEIRGVFRSGFYEYDNNVAVTSLENAQDLYGLDDAVQGLEVRLADPDRVETARDELDKALGDDYSFVAWSEENSTMAAVIVEKDVMLYILFFIVIVAAFGITCTLITFVVMKTREIGVLKALGASSGQVMRVFLSQSMVISVLGVLCGLALGLLAVHYRNPFLMLMRRATGMELFPANIYGFSELPALIIPMDLIIICGGSFLICLLAAAFPVWYASRLKPVEALRHE